MQEIVEYTIQKGNYKLKFLNIGAVITEYSYKNQNIVLAFKDYESYRNNSTYLGSIVGRSAGRIRDGEIEGWRLPLNQDRKHNLHGNDLHYRFYDVAVKESSAVLTLVDPEGDFPGNATIGVKYSLTEDGLIQEISATSDKPTVFNMTNHSYFNLNHNTSILNHKLQIEADQVLQLDEDLLPIGTIEVAGTAFDFNTPKQINDALEQGHDQFKYTKFIDHPFKLTGKIGLENDELKLEIETDQDYVVVYAGNYIGDETNRLKCDMNKDYYAICLETQAAPGNCDLTTEYKSITKYKLSSR